MKKSNTEQTNDELAADEFLTIKSQMEGMGDNLDKRAKFVMKYMLWGLLIMALWSLLLFLSVYYHYLVNIPILVTPLMGLALMLPLASLANFPMQKYRPLAKKMLVLEDTRGVNLILDMLADTELRSLSMPVVTRVLNRLSEEQALSINAWRRRQIHRELAEYGSRRDLSAEESEFPVAILKVMPYVGDANDVTLIRRLAHNAPDSRIQAAALTTLPPLEARLQAESNVATLLRAPGSGPVPVVPLPDVPLSTSPVLPSRERKPE